MPYRIHLNISLLSVPNHHQIILKRKHYIDLLLYDIIHPAPQPKYLMKKANQDRGIPLI